MSDNRTYAAAVALCPRSLATPDRWSVDPGDLRTKAAHYRRLAEMLVDPRVIAVVQACALDLETEASLNETGVGTFCVVSAAYGRC